MLKKSMSIFAVFVTIALIFCLLGCQEGPVERAGKKIDKAVEDIKK